MITKDITENSTAPPKGKVIWFTGLSGSGKSTLANEVAKYLKSKNIRHEILDGDSLRENVTAYLGFCKEDRIKNLQIAGFVAQKLSEHGVVVLASFISPYAEQRHKLKSQIKNFVEVYTNSTLETCKKRDVKGLYKKVADGKIKAFTGVDDPYQVPGNPDIEIKTDLLSIEQSVQKVIEFLEREQ